MGIASTASGSHPRKDLGLATKSGKKLCEWLLFKDFAGRPIEDLRMPVLSGEIFYQFENIRRTIKLTWLPVSFESRCQP